MSEKYTYCKHGLLAESCSYCNPLATAHQWTRKGRGEDRGEKLAREMYESAMSLPGRHEEPWSEEDFSELYTTMAVVPIKDTSSAEFRKACYTLGAELKRTSRAIKWQTWHMFFNIKHESRKAWDYRLQREASVEGRSEQDNLSLAL